MQQTTTSQALLHVLNYVNPTCGQQIILKGNDKLVLQAFSDSDWASCPDAQMVSHWIFTSIGKVSHMLEIQKAAYYIEI